MSRQIRLDEVLERYGTSFEDIKNAGVLHKWEIRAIEEENYGRLRLSTSVKIAIAARIPEAEAEKASDAIMLFLLEAVSRQSESHD